MSTQNLAQPAVQTSSSPAAAIGLTSEEAAARLERLGPNDPLVRPNRTSKT